MASPELLEVIRWNRAQAAGAREMAARARAAGRDEGAVLARELSAVHHDRVAARAEQLLAETLEDAPAPSPRPAAALP